MKFGLWCNGSTTGFGSVCPGSNPGSPTEILRKALLFGESYFEGTLDMPCPPLEDNRQLKKMSRHLHEDKLSSCPTCPIILVGFSHHIFSGCFYFPNTYGKKLVPVKDCYIIHAKVIRKKPFCNIKQRLLCKLKSRGGHRQWKLSETNT